MKIKKESKEIPFYDNEFYEQIREGSRQSAQIVVPLVINLVSPRSVIDVGCGTGTWLAVFREHGVKDILGLDGEYVAKKLLEISRKKFMPIDLKKPPKINKTFDLVVSLEMAEHLPAEFAEKFVRYLTELGPIILFSAAIPFQTGVSHINEQWPNYWLRLFNERDYVVVDCLRRKIWLNDKVERWYAQNIMFYVSKKHLKNAHKLYEEYLRTEPGYISIVHPKQYYYIINLLMQKIKSEAKNGK